MSDTTGEAAATTATAQADPPAKATAQADTSSKATTAPDTVPYYRFQEVVEKANGLKAELEKTQAIAAGATQWEKAAATAKAELEAERAARAAEASAWQEERGLIGIGLTDSEAQDAARFAWGRIPDADRPAGGIVDWLGELRKDPKKAPRILSPFIGEAAKPPPPKPGGGRPDVPAGPVTQEAIRAATAHGKSTGDWSQLEAITRAYRG